MSFGEAVSTVLTKKYATFSGRARRSEYWWFALFAAIVGVVLQVLAATTYSGVFTMLYWVFAIAIFIPGIAVTTRRLHDTGRSGWWQLIQLIPIIGSIVMLVFTVSDGQPGPNAYGPQVKNVDTYPVTA